MDLPWFTTELPHRDAESYRESWTGTAGGTGRSDRGTNEPDLPPHKTAKPDLDKLPFSSLDKLSKSHGLNYSQVGCIGRSEPL
jgi:hypothetical protein